MKTQHQDHRLGDAIARYITDQDTGLTSMLLVPVALIDRVTVRRETIDLPELKRMGIVRQAWEVGSMVQVQLAQDAMPPGAGMSMRHSESTRRLRLIGQQREDDGDTIVIHTQLGCDAYRCHHRLIYRHGDEAMEVRTAFENTGDRLLTLEMLSSFALENLSPFHPDDAPGDLFLHRLRGGWSLEGCHTIDSAESLNLQRSWLAYASDSERFGQIGTFPVRRFFPMAVIEDRGAGVCWGARIAWPGSWQMEASRHHDCLSLCGGLADQDFGHWSKAVTPGETFEAPPAHVAVAQGGFIDVNHALTRIQRHAANQHPETEHNLPVSFNEWCTNWGKPTHENMLRLADQLQGRGFTYLVMDAGWFDQSRCEPPVEPQHGLGEWHPCPNAFPDGIGATAQAIRDRGMIPGIWFEFEVTTLGSKMFGPDAASRLLQRDGRVIKNDGWRSFWDLRNPEVVEDLTQKVIGFLREHNFGYLKVDYNGSAGYGVDGAESPGEGLRQHIEGVMAFFQKIRHELPDVVIENCASGGHRLEPAMIGATALSAITDAHECHEIPRIAAAMQHVLLPRQALVLTAIHGSDSNQRLYYSLAANFLGRFCLTGTIESLSESQWAIVHDALDLYGLARPILLEGRSRMIGITPHAIRHGEGTQAVLRIADDGQQALLVCHSFDQPLGQPLEIPLEGEWTIAHQFNPVATLECGGAGCWLQPLREHEGCVFLLRKT